MLVAYRVLDSAVFLYGFAKNEQENIGPDELASLREIAAARLDADADRIANAVGARELQEVEHGEAVSSDIRNPSRAATGNPSTPLL